MELVERYLDAVRFWLPRDPGEDLVAELREDLRSRMEDREAELGRPLEARETAALLREVGHPLKVAGQYLPSGPWLDPVQSVLFRFVMKVVLLWVLTPVLVVAAVPGLLLADAPLRAAVSALSGAVHAYLYALGTITLAFWVLARLQARRVSPGFLRDWDPLTLPVLPRPGEGRPTPRGSSITEVVLGLLFLAWWTGGTGTLWGLLQGRLIPLQPGSLWSAFLKDFHGQVIVLTGASIALSALAIAWPRRSRTRLLLKAGLDVLGVVLLGAFLAAHRPLVHAALDGLQRIRQGGAGAGAAIVDFCVAVCLLISVAAHVLEALIGVAKALWMHRASR